MPSIKTSTGQRTEADAINWAYAHMYTDVEKKGLS